MKDGSTKWRSSNIDTGTFVQYFNAVNNTEDQFYQADEDVLEFNERYLDGELQIMFDQKCTKGYIGSLYVHYVYLLIY